uniref:DOMON domain-containing protein n=1 Tax=Steinernema glaseri TaxID=37863 RepID=A0A1I7ZEN5_9BILA
MAEKVLLACAEPGPFSASSYPWKPLAPGCSASSSLETTSNEHIFPVSFVKSSKDSDPIRIRWKMRYMVGAHDDVQATYKKYDEGGIVVYIASAEAGADVATESICPGGNLTGNIGRFQIYWP